MSDVKYNAPITLSTLMVVSMSVLIFTPILSLAFDDEQSSSHTQELTSNHLTLPAGTLIPIRYDKAEKIILTKEETMTLTLKVASNITNAQGAIVIPDGSQIIGEIKPSGKGPQFFSHTILIKSKNNKNLETHLDAISQIITTIETLIQGANLEKNLKRATVSDQAQKLITSFREAIRNRRTGIESEELQALAGWFLGGEMLELVSINPEKDLNLTLRSELVLK